jgi:hypothetical protein
VEVARPVRKGIALLIALAWGMLIAGCASVVYQRPSGTWWGYVWGETLPRGPAIFIAPDEPTCLRLVRPPLGQCRPVRFGEGRSWWLTQSPDRSVIVGNETKGMCEASRSWRGESPCTLDRVEFQ